MKPKPTHPTNTAYGYQPDGTWLFGDCTIGSDGAVEAAVNIIPGIGDAPRLLLAKPANLEARHPHAVLRMFLGLLEQSLGPEPARHSLGLAFAYAAAPYLRMHGHGHPGLWLHGWMGTGKSSTARWLAAIYGFGWREHTSVSRPSTVEGLTRSLRQFCCLPVVFDDYRAGRVGMDLEAVIRAPFDRDASFSGVAGKLIVQKSQPLTTPIVCGEHASYDAATRSRYLHLCLTKAVRLSPAELHTLSEVLMKQLHLVGLSLLKRHAEFGGAVVDALNTTVFPADQNRRTAYTVAVAEICYQTADRLLAQ